MSWEIVGHPEAGTFPTEGHAHAAAWRIADAAGELTRPEVRQQVIRERSRGHRLDLTPLWGSPERSAHAHAVREECTLGVVRVVDQLTIDRSPDVVGMVLERMRHDLMAKAAEEGAVLGEVRWETCDRPEMFALEIRAWARAWIVRS